MAGSVAERVRGLIEETVNSLGLRVWDVKFLKEGASWYLRVFLDSDNGIGIDDCTNVSRAIDPILDEADPIDKSYYLEVCSPGLNRELSRPEHFEQLKGCRVNVRLYTAKDGRREYSGLLLGYNSGEVELDIDGQTIKFEKGEYSRITLDDDSEQSGASAKQ